jgi:hypothetical protein
MVDWRFNVVMEEGREHDRQSLGRQYMRGEDANDNLPNENEKYDVSVCSPGLLLA